jgi:hypothetical protein
MKHVPNRNEPRRAESSEVDKSTNSQIPDATSKRDVTRERKFREILEEINQKYAGVFRRLSK